MPEELRQVTVGELTTAVRGFSKKIASLTEQVTDLADRTGALNKSISQHRRYFFVTGTVAAAVVLLIAAVVSVMINQHTTDKGVLCPLYVFLRSRESIVQNAPSLTAEQRAANAEMFSVIHQGYDRLGCS